MQTTLLKLFLVLTVVPLILILIMTKLPSLPSREKIFSSEGRPLHLGLDFTLEYEVTDVHRPR